MMQFKQQQHYQQLVENEAEATLESATFEVLKTAQSSTVHTYSSMCSSNQLSSSAASGYFSTYRSGKLRSNNDYHQVHTMLVVLRGRLASVWRSDALMDDHLTPLQAAVGVVQKGLRPTILKNIHLPKACRVAAEMLATRSSRAPKVYLLDMSQDIELKGMRYIGLRAVSGMRW